tara:strand:+ start:333 stop:878 length:546 start_codon:yes stop_codon:yes gene_type:complete
VIKIVKNFLPYPLFKQLLSVVESQKMDWHWQPQSIHYGPTGGDGKWMFVNVIKDGTITSKELMPLFSVFKDFQDEHYKGDTILKMKLNLNPNQGTPIEFGLHTDIIPPDPDVITSVFNFHTCNGYTKILSPDKPETLVPSIANSIVIFDNPLPHAGVSQTDIDRRIVLNMNVQRTIEDDNI